MEPYALLSKILDYIEQNIYSKITIEKLARRFYISVVHLQRIFKFYFNVTIISYIRSRKITTSIEYLLCTNMNILDIALEFGFEHEQSYIRAFKREYGITPGEYKKNHTIIKIVPPLQLLNTYKLNGSMISGPDIVVVPQFFVAGKLYRVKKEQSGLTAPLLAKDFFYNERTKLPDTINPDVYIGLTRVPPTSEDWTYYLPSVQVATVAKIPQGFEYDIFNTSVCARFKYIGNHNFSELNGNIAYKMYQSIHQFFNSQTIYEPFINVHFERIDTNINDDKYCLMEWYAPLIPKNNR